MRSKSAGKSLKKTEEEDKTVTDQSGLQYSAADSANRHHGMKLSPRDAIGDACRECTHYEGQLNVCLCCTKKVPHNTTQHNTTQHNTHVRIGIYIIHNTRNNI